MEVFFVVTSKYPGNNWRVAAGTDQNWVLHIVIDENDGDTLRDGDGNPLTNKKSKRLTCWRYLHVEVDSMEAPDPAPPPQDLFGVLAGNSTNLAQTVLTHNTKNWLPDDQLIGAEVDPDTNDADPDAYVVTDSAQTTVTCDGVNMLANAQTGNPYSIDTDDVDPGDVPAPNTSLMPDAFAPACITVVEDTGKNTGNCTFVRNIRDEDLCMQGSNHRGTSTESNNYWCVYIQAAYEGGRELDNDPDTEETYDGACCEDEPEYAFLFKEPGRDVCNEEGWVPTIVERRTVCHEIGHQFERGEEYSGNCLMRQTPDPNIRGSCFCADCIAGTRHESHP